MDAPDAVTAKDARPPSRRPRSGRLPSGRMVGLDAMGRVVGRQSSRLVVLAGPVACGKTTLLASIYEGFGSGVLDGFAFSGSDTLVAFEERCHDSRLSSGLEKPTTARTTRTDPGSLLHLAMTPTTGGSRCHTFINDISGEIFEDLIDEPQVASSLLVLPRASRIQVLIDGELVASRGRRDFEVYRVRTLVQAVVQFGNPPAGSRIDVVITKMDLLEDAAARTFATENAALILKALPDGLRGSVIKSCGRSSSPDLVPTGLGSREILSAWTGVSVAEPTPRTRREAR